MLDGENDALHEVVFFVVLGVVVGFEVVAEEFGEDLVERGAEFATEFVNKGVGGAACLAVDELDEHKALREGVVLEFAGIVVKELLLGELDGRLALLAGHRLDLLLKNVKATLALLGEGEHELDVADELLVATYFGGRKEGERFDNGDLLEIVERHSVAIKDRGETDVSVLGRHGGRKERQQ